ncbi:MAG: hypothetical protein GY864_03410 [Desulfobacterales bacterium]|nr:hypothetical protein [Desulfobacterales bacterium]
MNLKRLIIWSIIGAGISSVTTQLLIVREFLSQFHGNEITISLVLFSWLLLGGLGSLAEKAVKRHSIEVYCLIVLLIALLPLLQIIAIRVFREISFTHGVSPGFYPVFFYILLIIAPYSMLVGFVLPYSQKVLNDAHYPFESGDLYIFDNMGDIAGGALFSFFFVYWLKPFPTIALTSFLLILVAILLYLKFKKYVLLFLISFPVLIFYYYSTDSFFEKNTLAEQYGDIVKYVESPYGRIVISKEGEQYTFWESGVSLYSGSNVIMSEEKVHYPLCQLGQAENILLVSGGLDVTLSEISKYKPEHVDYVELDPNLTKSAIELGIIKGRPSLTIMNLDARRYIKMTDRKYDAIIIDLPDPDTFQINRFFTGEFFFLAKKILNRGGILSMSIEYSPNYISDIRKDKLSIVYNTARLHFANVLTIPGDKVYFICRDGELHKDIPARLKSKSIETSYIEGFFYGNVTEDRLKQLKDSLDTSEYVNTDFKPRLMNVVFQEWFIKHGTSPRYFLFALLVLIIIYLIFMRKEEYILFSTGLATMGIEMLIIFVFQIIYGYIYLKIGAIVTASLLGLLPGAMIGKYCGRNNTLMLLVSEMLLLALLFLSFIWITYFKSELHQIYFLAYCFVFSLLCGFQFPVAANTIGEKNSPAAGCLAADLWGACVGTLLTGAVIIPLWGIQVAVLFLMLMKISSIIIWIRCSLEKNS